MQLTPASTTKSALGSIADPVDTASGLTPVTEMLSAVRRLCRISAGRNQQETQGGPSTNCRALVECISSHRKLRKADFCELSKSEAVIFLPSNEGGMP